MGAIEGKIVANSLLLEWRMLGKGIPVQGDEGLDPLSSEGERFSGD